MNNFKKTLSEEGLFFKEKRFDLTWVILVLGNLASLAPRYYRGEIPKELWLADSVMWATFMTFLYTAINPLFKKSNNA